MSTPYSKFGKRALDVVLASVTIFLTLPLMLVVALLVRLHLGAPVLFRQARPGRAGRLFTLLKFRTMRNDNDANGPPRPDDLRLTPLGRALRRWSLDELPELFNVLGGQMSLVGPRPLLEEYLERYSAEQSRRHEVLPGITGWAQVNGRNDVSWARRLEMDVWYVDHMSLGTDLRILWATLATLLTGKGIHAAGHATMPRFQGVSLESREPRGAPSETGSPTKPETGGGST